MTVRSCLGRVYILAVIGVALLAFALVNTVLYHPPAPPPPLHIHVGDPITGILP